MIDWIFFDIGGVLADESAYQDYRKAVCREVAKSFIGDISDEAYARAYTEAGFRQGSITEHVLSVLLEQAGRADAVQEALTILATKPKASYGDLEVVRPEAAAVVQALAAKYKIGIIANQPPIILEKLEAAGVLQYLSDSTISADGPGKPDPAYYLAVLAKTGANPKRSIMIDDNLTRGIAPAKKLGMTTIWFGGILPAEGVDYVVQGLDELPGLLLG